MQGEKDSSARKSARAGKGRNPRLEREDEEVAIPTKEIIYPIFFQVRVFLCT